MDPNIFRKFYPALHDGDATITSKGRLVTVKTNMSWRVYVAGKLVTTAMNKLLWEFPCHIRHGMLACNRQVCREGSYLPRKSTIRVDIVDKWGRLSASDQLAFVDSAGDCWYRWSTVWAYCAKNRELLCALSGSYPRQCKCMPFSAQGC